MTSRRPSWSDRLRRAAAIGSGLLWLSGAGAATSAAPPDAALFGTAAVLADDFPGLHGLASFYGFGFKGRRTATGERFDPYRFTAASNRFPLGTQLAVLRPDNGRCAIVKVNDRMHVKHRRRIVDVSRGVAEYLGMIRAGVAVVRVAPLPADWQGEDEAACRAVFGIDEPAGDAETPDSDGAD
ncbi:MAG TPA: septal ring lytic transglycosylase RlpA family protein [Azonexus sp.]